MSSFDEAVAIRVATDSDVPGIRSVIRSAVNGIAFRDYPPEVLENWGANTPEASVRQRRAIQDSRELTWVAISGDAIVGFSALDPQSGEVRAVYVAAQTARRGVGTRLLLELESRARALGLSRLILDSSITAEPFYRHHGYVSVREHVHTLATGHGMRAIRMEKDLAQVHQ